MTLQTPLGKSLYVGTLFALALAAVGALAMENTKRKAEEDERSSLASADHAKTIKTINDRHDVSDANARTLHRLLTQIASAQNAVAVTGPIGVPLMGALASSADRVRKSGTGDFIVTGYPETVPATGPTGVSSSLSTAVALGEALQNAEQLSHLLEEISEHPPTTVEGVAAATESLKALGRIEVSG